MNAEVTPLHPQAQTPETAPETQQRVNGVFDIPSPRRVSGWAIDRADPAAAVEVEVYREGTCIAKMRANRYRKDLERGGIGTGRYGFSVDLDPPLEPGLNFTLEVRATTADGVSGELRATGAAQASEEPATRLLEQTYERLSDLSAQVHRLTVTSSPATPVDTAKLEATLERIELIQARLEQTLSAVEPPQTKSEGFGLKVAAAVALLIGSAALALGLYSVFWG